MTEKTAVQELYIELNNHDFTEAAQVYDYLQQQLQLPGYFGKNLDALYDCLTDIFTPVTIRIRRTWRQDKWFKAIAKVIRDAARENGFLTVR